MSDSREQNSSEENRSATATVIELDAARSPLYMAMRDPVLDQFMDYLAECKAEQERDAEKHVQLELSREQIIAVRDSFRKSILDGERQLHILAHLLSSVLLDAEFELHCNVIGVLPSRDDRPFLIRERITKDTLFSVTDIDLGNHMLDHFRYNQDGEWVPLTLSANFVEYLPLKRPVSGVNRLTSRVKAEEELCNKLVDELFSVDVLLARDKHLRRYSKFIKDIFGIKIVCDSEEKCLEIHDWLESMSFSPDDLIKLDSRYNLGIQILDADLQLKFLETKDYLNCPPEQMKKTGWKALKSVVVWQDSLFEIQVQPLVNYYLELDHMSGPSHRSFKMQRDLMREELAGKIPLYRFYRDLLKMLFMEMDVCFEYQNASVLIT